MQHERRNERSGVGTTFALGALAALAFAPAALAGTASPLGESPDERARDPVRVVASLPVYASIVREIGGTEVDVSSIADPNEDAHFVRPKPSFARDLRRADMFVTTGLDLELWAPTVLDRAGNARVSEGGEGYVTAYTGIELLDIPETVDRSAGDIHLYGNPHLHTDPLRALQIARNITSGLKQVAPDRADLWDRGLATFTDQIHRRLFGDRLVELIGGRALEELAKSGNFSGFLRENEWQGTPLTDMLGGWLAAAEPFRGREMICYHSSWTYFEDRFGVSCAAYVEVKPGIPPTPRHVARLMDLMQEQGYGVLLAESYFDRNRVETVARRGGARAVIVPLYPGGTPGIDDYFELVDHWVRELSNAFREAA